MADDPKIDVRELDASEQSLSALDDSLRGAFTSAGAEIDAPDNFDKTPEPKADPTLEPEPKEPKAEPKSDPDDKSGEADDTKPGDAPKAKGPLPKGAKAKTDPIKPKGDEEELPDAEKIKSPKLSAEGQKGWNVLKDSYAKSKTIVEQLRSQNTKLTSQLADKATTSNTEVEAMKKELDELRGYRASFDYQFDPEFKKQYSEPMDKLEGEMRKMLLESGVRQDVVDGLDWSDPATMDRVSKGLDEHVNSITSDRFRMRAKDFIELSVKKGDFLDQFKGKHKEFTAKRAEEMERKSTEDGARQLKSVNAVSMRKDEKTGEYKFPFLLKFDPQEGASAEEVERVEAHNKMADMMRGRLQRVMSAKEPEDRAQVAVAAVAASYLNEKYLESQQEIASLRASLKKYNDVSSERRGSQGKPAGSGGYKTPESLDLNDALNSAFPGMS